MNKKIYKIICMFALIMLYMAFLIYGISYIDDCHIYGTPFSFIELLSYLGTGLLCVFAFVLLLVLLIIVIRLIDRKSIKTLIQLTANNISAKARLKTVNQIYPNLLYFMYSVLERNNEFLNLSLGKDFSDLIPNGYRPIYRQGSVFYIFQLVMPEKPNYDEKTLKQLIQSYIDSELINYGISGLKSCFNSRVYGVVPSVYVDRAYYNENQHMLNFAVLYVCTEDDVNYVVKAKKRDKAVPLTEKEVFDDDVI